MLLSDPQINFIVRKERKKCHHLRIAFLHRRHGERGGWQSVQENVWKSVRLVLETEA